MYLSPADELLAHQTAETVDHVYTSDRSFYDRTCFNLHSCSDELFLKGPGSDAAPGAAPLLYAFDLGLELAGFDTDDLDALFLISDGDLVFTPGDISGSPATCGFPAEDCIAEPLELDTVRSGVPFAGLYDRDREKWWVEALAA